MLNRARKALVKVALTLTTILPGSGAIDCIPNIRG
jgi:hypothetical protein